MTPESGLFLAKARRLLAEAQGMFDIHYNEAAGRTAYLAGFHAAQALISDKTGRAVKRMAGSGRNFTGSSEPTRVLMTHCATSSGPLTI